MNWQNILHYALIVFACWAGLCLLTSFVCKKHRAAAAGASMAPVLIGFLLIALIASADERRRKRQERAVPRLILLVAIPIVVALAYWHTEVWTWLSRVV